MTRKQQHSVRSESAPAGASRVTQASRVKEAAPIVAAAASKAGKPAQKPLDQESIARLAYSYWAGRGYTGGSAEEDWLRAENELRSN